MGDLIRFDTGSKPCCSDVVWERTERLFKALPALSYYAIGEAIGENVSTVNDLLHHVREHSKEHGWTVPHVHRGQPRSDVDYRFVAVLVENGEEPYMEDEGRGQVYGGAIATLRQMSSMTRHQNTALALAAEYCQDPVDREAFEDLVEEQQYFAKRIDRLLRRVKHNGTTG